MAGRPQLRVNPVSASSDIVMLTVAEGRFKDFDHVIVDFGKGEHKVRSRRTAASMSLVFLYIYQTMLTHSIVP